MSITQHQIIIDVPSFDNVVWLEEARRLAAEELGRASNILNTTRFAKADEMLAYAVVLDKREALSAAEAALEAGLVTRAASLRKLASSV
jgi:hypothetical protein